MDQLLNQPGMPQALTPLPAGAIVGAYVIERLIRSNPADNTYLGHASAQADTTYHLLEYPASEERSLATLAKLRLEHPALLAPCEAVTLNERIYIITPAVPNARPIEPLPPVEALRQIIAIGEALAYLHSRGVAHLRVLPASIVLADGQARLSGLDDAQALRTGGDDAHLLFERDANFLALTLGELAARDQPHARGSPLEQAIAKIREHGISHSYLSVAQVIADCQQALASTQGAALPGGQAPALAFSVLSGHATSIGRVRSNNEDALGDLLLTAIDGQGQSRLIACFVVADGMGGEARGEVASQIAAHSILEQVIRRVALPLLQGAAGTEAAWTGAANALEREQQMREALLDGFRSANRQIRALVHAQGKAIGTTTTALLIVGGQALIAHIGDSRAYRLNRGVLTTLTEDHSYVQRLIQLGQLDPTDQASHPRRNALYRALGQQDDLDVDLVSCPLEAGDRLLLCSDGLWDAVPETTLIRLFAEKENGMAPAALAARLVALADEAGGQDNSTAIVIEIDSAQPATSAQSDARGR